MDVQKVMNGSVLEERKRIAKEYKRLAYKLEDIMLLGKKLPAVALREMEKIAEKFSELPDIPDYLPNTQMAIAIMLLEFASKNKEELEFEREVKNNFKEKCGIYGLKYLSFFETEKHVTRR